MHYFTFADKDTTLYENSSSLNSGLDEILEIRKDVSDTGAFKEVSRTLIKFDLTYISQSIVSRLIPDSGSKAARFYLNLYDAHPTSLAASQSLYAYPVSQSWEMGEGHSYDNPVTKEGCSWNFSKGITDGTLWTPETTASGATWYQNYASGSLDFITGSAGIFGTSSLDEVQITVAGTEYNFIATASAPLPDDASPNFYFSTGSTTSEFGSNLITEINSADIGISASFSGTTTLHITASSITTAGLTDISVDTGSDEGFIIKRRGNVGNTDKFSDENNTQRLGNFSFFSSDTNTKYPPTLEMVWDDSKWNVGSLSALTSANLEDSVLYMKGLRPEYNQKSKVKFRVVGRERFPDKTYSTTPSTLTVKTLPPSSSYYSILDAETDEVIVPYGSGSQLSCDSSGNYFNVWMDGFQPERYYKLEYRIQSGSGTDEEINQYYDEGFTFKVTL